MPARSTRRPHSHARRKLGVDGMRHARSVVDRAWADLPAAHRALLRAIGADRCKVVDRPLGEEIADLRHSAALEALDLSQQRRLNQALGVWLPELRLVVIDAVHENHTALDEGSYAAALARVAWHEWGHALSIDRATDEDIAAGERLLSIAPPGIATIIRSGGYRSKEQTHELLAEIYALLVARRRLGQTGRPKWLAEEIWNLTKRVTGWPE